MSKTMKEICAEWKELRPQIGNLIGHLTSKEAQLVSMEEAYERGCTDGWAERDGLKSAEIGDAYDKGYNDGFEAGQHEATTLEYQRGLEDAWEAAKAYCSGFSYYESEKCFGKNVCDDNYAFFSAKPEVRIRQIKAYEEQKKAEAEIKVGDWVKDDGGLTGIVTFCNEVNDHCDVMWRDGAVGENWPKDNLTKLNRPSYPMADLLRGMFEDEDKLA